MSNALFLSPPNFKLLHHLARGPLDQSQNLTRAVRQWVWLRWFYSQEGYQQLRGAFTGTACLKAFFQPGHTCETEKEALSHHDSDCRCTKTTAAWLSLYDVSVEEWVHALESQAIAVADIELLLQRRLFACTRKSLQDHLEQLVNLNWLQHSPEHTGRSKHYLRVESFPFQLQPDQHSISDYVTANELANLSQAVSMLSFLDPRLAPIANQLADQVFEQAYNPTQRVFLHIDYVLPDDVQGEVDDLQDQLQHLWQAAAVAPILLTYESAHLQNQLKECVVFPVCIYYVQRAKYLCAYGSTPDGEINWYNFRLDRIRSKRLQPLAWTDPHIPQRLLEQYQHQQLPQPGDIQDWMQAAWGFDFYKPSALLLLRFDRDFHDRYIQGTFRHQTFQPLTYDEVLALIRQETRHPEQERSLLEVLKSRSPDDAYYQAQYRVTDNNVVLRLRAWRPAAEVLFPWALRQQFAAEAKQEWNLYQTNPLT